MRKIIIISITIALIASGCGQSTKKQVTNESSSVCQGDTLSKTEENTEDSIANTELKENKTLTRNNIWDFVNEKAEWFKKGLEPQKDIDLLPLDFKAFYEKFTTDSVFQINNIQFDSLIGVIGECDTTIILNSKNWEIQTDIINDFDKSPKEKWNNYFFFDSTRVYFEFELIEIGVIYQFGFEKINGKWKQTLSFVNVC